MRAVSAAVLLVLSAIGSGGCAESCAAESRGHGRDSEIRLDYHPMEDRVAVFVRVASAGHAEAVRYSPYESAVVSVARGALEPRDVQGLFSAAADPGFCKPGGSSPADGVGEGDVFEVWIRTEVGPRSCSGIAQRSTDAVRTWIGKVLALGKSLADSPQADAYVRSEPIEVSRRDWLGHDGRTRFVPLADVPDTLRSVVSDAIRAPADFHALDLASYQRLLKLCSHGNDFFIETPGGSSHQLSLYTTRRATEHKKEVETP